LKQLPKRLVMAVFIVLAFPLAAVSGFGRFRPVYLTGAHMVALAPGLLGDYLRSAYYWMTLESCSLWCRISFGVILSNPSAKIEDGVYIGPYSVLGRVRIGRRTQIASLVQILSGARQHARDESGEITGAEQGTFDSIAIGANSWIGAAAIVMAEVGEKSTIGAGSVVTRPVPAGVVAVGNPARVLGPSGASPPRE
jgi:virginiamycin A acetyltransferase